MTSCDDYEVAVEQRLHGVLDAAASGLLAAHLASCAGCRAFETGAKQLEEAMRMDATQTSGEVEWDRLGRSVERWRRHLLAGSWQAAATLIVIVPFLALCFGQVVGGITGGVTVVLWGWLATRRRIAEARAAGRSNDQLLDFLRAQLDQQIKTEKQNALALPFFVLLPLYGLLSRDITPWSLFGTAMLIVLFLALAARSRFVLLPRLQRERAELS